MDLTGIGWEVSKLWSGTSDWLLRTRQQTQRKTQAVFTPERIYLSRICVWARLSRISGRDGNPSVPRGSSNQTALTVFLCHLYKFRITSMEMFCILPGLPLYMLLIVVCAVCRYGFQLPSGKLQGGVQTVQLRPMYVLWRVGMVRSMRLWGNVTQSGIRLQVEWRTSWLWTMRTSMATVKVWTELLITEAKEQSCSWNATCRSADNEILCLLRNPKFRNHVHNSPPLVLIPRQIHPVKTLIFCSLKIFPSFVSRGLQIGHVLSGVPSKIWYVFLIFPLHLHPSNFSHSLKWLPWDMINEPNDRVYPTKDAWMRNGNAV
jgi:hypothetical protein